MVTATRQDLVATGADRLRIWREAVRAAAASTTGVRDAICPFGFEATADRRYLRNRLTRFYVYLDLDPAASRGAAETTLVDAFCARLLAIGGPSTVSIRVVVTDADTTVLDRPAADSVLYVRSVRASEELLDAYALYLALAAPLVAEHKLHEARLSDTSPAARSYVCQLAVIGLAIHGDRSLNEARQVEALKGLIRTTPNRDMHTGEAVTRPPSGSERAVLRDVAFPLHHSLAATLRSCGDECLHHVVDFHSSRSHTIEASASALAACRKLVRKRYLAYPEALCRPS